MGGIWLSVGVLSEAGTFKSNFNTSLSSAAKVYGDALVENGVVKLTKLTTNTVDLAGSLVIDDLDAGKPVSSFTARFKLRMDGGSGGEGVSFNFAPNVPEAVFGEAGAGSGLSVLFDSFENSAGETQGIIVKYRGETLAATKLNPRTGTNWVDVTIEARAEGTINVTYGTKAVHANVFGYLPLAGRFGIGARSGQRTDDHDIDDLNITTTPVAKPYATRVAPIGRNIRAGAVVEIQLQDFQTTANPASIQLSFNGQVVTPTTASLSGVTTITYDPPGLLESSSTNEVKLVFSDRATPATRSTIQYGFVVEQYARIPSSAAVPRTSVVLTNAGFRIRTVQARANAGLASIIARAEAQLAGTLIDPATGRPFENEARANPSSSDGTYEEPETINFEQEGSPIGNFTDGEKRIPGIPGRGGHNDGIAMEALTYLDLPAGYHRFGVNSDDGFKVTMARDVRDAFAGVLGSFNGDRRSSDTEFSFLVETAGMYPCRLVWFESGGAANVEFFSIASDGRKILINDPKNPNAIKAYRPTNAMFETAPYVESASPRIGETGVSRKPVLQVVLKDAQSQVATNSIRLSLNGETLTPNIVKAAGTTTVTAQVVNLLAESSQNHVSLTYADNAAPRNTVVRDWSFVTARAAKPTGHWDFNDGSLKATRGGDLEFGDGATGELSALTEFGTTTSFGIPDIKGEPAKVMKHARPIQPGLTHPGYLIKHGIMPNGGGIKVNQWTLLMDVFFPDPQEGGFSSLIETEDVATGGDLFVRWNSIAGPGTGGIGIAGQYTGDGRTRMNVGQWQRLAIVVDLTASPPVLGKFIDGVKFQDQGLTPPQLDGRYALGPTARLFADDDNEVNTFYVNSIQVRDGKMTDDEIAALGAPTADGIPLPTQGVSLAYTRTGNSLQISWPASATGFVLERTATLQNPAWKPVPGVANNMVTITLGGTSQFYRLKR